ncbi:hypothetical protein GQ457_10G018990 [Hibiscus cannabinus]
MGRMGFDSIWWGWIWERFSSARLSVLFNGSVTKEFGFGRGFRQGDPLSPLLFVLVAEALHVLLERAVAAGLVRGVEANSGLQINFGKSSLVAVGVEADLVEEVAGLLRCELRQGDPLSPLLFVLVAEVLAELCIISDLRIYLFSGQLRQGDPLSPLLFVLVAEALHVFLERAVAGGLVRGVEVVPCFALSHLQFADDTIMFYDASLEVSRNVQRILFFFQACSGLQINFGKSSLVAVGVEADLVEEVASLLRCEVGSLMFMYLGLPLGCNPREKAVWDPMVSHVRSWLAGWKRCSLSFAARVTLVNSVLSSLLVYFMGVFVVPRGVIAL